MPHPGASASTACITVVDGFARSVWLDSADQWPCMPVPRPNWFAIWVQLQCSVSATASNNPIICFDSGSNGVENDMISHSSAAGMGT